MSNGFCRDCLADATSAELRCGACGSPRLLHHEDLATLSVAHIDCEQGLGFPGAVQMRHQIAAEILDEPLVGAIGLSEAGHDDPQFRAVVRVPFARDA